MHSDSADSTPHRPVYLKSMEWIEENLCRVVFYDDERGFMETIYEVKRRGVLTHKTYERADLLKYPLEGDPLWLSNNWTKKQHDELVAAVSSFCWAVQGHIPGS